MFQTVLFFLGFVALYMQGAISKCAIVAMLAVLCLGSSILCALIERAPNWLRVIAGFSMMIAFGILAYSAAELFAVYGQLVAEYRFTAITSVILMCIAAPAVVPLPDRKEQPATN